MNELEGGDRESLLQRVLDNLFTFVGVLELDGTLIQVNHAAIEATGVAEPDVIGRKFWDCYWWNYQQDVQDKLKNAIDQATAGETVNYTAKIRSSDNEWMWIDFQIAPLRDSNGNITHLIPSATDITGRKNAEQASRETETRYRRLSNLIDQGFCIMEVIFDENEVGIDQRFLEVNSVFERHTGLIDPVGKTARELVPNLEPEWPERYGRIAKTGTSEHFVDYSAAMKRWFEVDAFRIGKPEQHRVALLFTDISQRKLAEEATRESEERFRNLADNMSQFAWMADQDGSIFWYNRRWYEFTGTTLEQMRGWGWRDVHHPEHVDRVVAKISQCFQSGEVWEDTFPLRAADGEYRWFLSRAVPIRDSNGQVQRWFGTNTDVTQLRELEAELQKSANELALANRRKDEFLANFSHEIRSPMTAILGYLDLLELNTEEDHRYVEIIRRNGEFLLTLINDILDLSKIEAGQLETATMRFNPRELLDDVVELMKVRANENNLSIIVQPTEELPEQVGSDVLRIRQILINLVGNAVKFTAQGSVEIKAVFDDRSQELSFEVVDTGIGIPSTEIERLFLPFEQMDSSISRQFGGSGLGLAICRRLAMALGGNVSASSELGVGSRFCLRIPVKVWEQGEDESGVAVYSVSSKASRSIKNPSEVELGLNVLVVDDRRDIRFLLRRILETSGCQVVECSDGEQALQQIGDPADCPFDAVIMDVQMPGMDGLAAVRELRERGFERPVIALTANAMSRDRNECFDAGYSDYLSKPIDKSELINSLIRCTKRSSRE